MANSFGLPDLVVSGALAAGAHNDCLLNSSFACFDCNEIVISILEDLYGQKGDTVDIIKAILTDMR